MALVEGMNPYPYPPGGPKVNTGAPPNTAAAAAQAAADAAAAPPPPHYNSYTAPSTVEQQYRDRGALHALHQAQLRYAQNRIAGFRRVSGLVGGDFQGAMGGDLSNPVAAYAHLSQLFAAASHAAGYADPRAYLVHLLHQAATNFRQGNGA